MGFTQLICMFLALLHGATFLHGLQDGPEHCLLACRLPASTLHIFQRRNWQWRLTTRNVGTSTTVLQFEIETKGLSRWTIVVVGNDVIELKKRQQQDRFEFKSFCYIVTNLVPLFTIRDKFTKKAILRFLKPKLFRIFYPWTSYHTWWQRYEFDKNCI